MGDGTGERGEGDVGEGYGVILRKSYSNCEILEMQCLEAANDWWFDLFLPYIRLGHTIFLFSHIGYSNTDAILEANVILRYRCAKTVYDEIEVRCYAYMI